MCGISAVVAREGSPAVVGSVLRMHEPIRHRGPDGEGVLLWDDPDTKLFDDVRRVADGARASVAFAFRRLKIVDLSDAASQPMGSADATVWIVFNGEIYNFSALRAELQADGRRFRTTGDTEVILAAYERWGEECFARFEGMWAIVVLDLRRRCVVGSRDRFGIKPLYYHVADGALFLSSEIRQILAATGDARANAPLVRSFLAGDRDTVLDETFFDGIRSVPPGSWFSVPVASEVRGLQFRRYWDLDHVREHRPPVAYREAVDRVGELMTKAVRTHSQADVPVGSLLSGGLDSSTVAALLAGAQPDAPTFSFGFRDAAPQVCEMPYVDTLVRQKRLRNFETSFDAEWIAGNAGRVVSALEEPPLAMPVFAQFRTFELCRQHGTTVILDGQGSDEIFAGYPYHERLLLIEHLRHGRARAFAREAQAIAARDSMSATRLVARAFVEPPLYAIAQKVRRRLGWINSAYGGRRGTGGGSRNVNDRLHHDVKSGNVKIILGYADKNAMQFSIEARVPYFDRELVEYAFRLPATYKVGGATRKRILRDFARTFLPREITERRDRMGFATPDGIWLRGPLWPHVRAEIMDTAVLELACFDGKRLRRFIRGFERGEHRDFRAIWRIWMLAVWKREFAVRFA